MDKVNLVLTVILFLVIVAIIGALVPRCTAPAYAQNSPLEEGAASVVIENVETDDEPFDWASLLGICFLIGITIAALANRWPGR